MENLFIIYNILSTGFAICTSLLIVAFLLLKQKRSQLRDLLESSHIVFLAAVCLNILLAAADYIAVLMEYYSNTPENITYFPGRALTGFYLFLYWLLTLFPLILPQLLWWKNKRRNILIALLMIICASFPLIKESLILLITSMDRDFLPSSWTLYSPSIVELFVPLLIYSACVTVVHLARKRFTTLSQRSS